MSTELSKNDVITITKSAFAKVLPKKRIDRVEINRGGFALPGDLGITVILSGRGSVKLTGDQLAKIQDSISTELWNHGDERFPYLRYLTTQEAKSLAS